MAQFKEVDIKDFTINPFTSIGKDWMLVAAEKDDGTVNALTAAWGGLGWLWEKPVAFVFIRQSRYTKEFIDEAGKLSLSFPSEEHREKLRYMGRVSGRDEDKIAACGLTVAHWEDIPYFEEGSTVILGHCVSEQLVTEDCFIDPEIAPKRYPDHDLHSCYVVEIDRILQR